MKKMLILMVCLVQFVFASGVSKIEQRILSFERGLLSKNPKLEIKDLKIGMVKKLDNKWNGYLLLLNGKFETNILKDVPIVCFSDGNMITNDLYNLKMVDYKTRMIKDLDSSFYKDENLIYGDKKSKNKIVIFSDPLCPICTELVPEYLDFVKNNKGVSLYYYSFPLDMHPTANMLSRVLLVLLNNEKDQNKRLELINKFYTSKFEKYFDPYKETNQQKVLDVFNKLFSLNYKLKDLNSPIVNNKMVEEIKYGTSVFIQGTPTIFVNGVYDFTRKSHLKFSKK